LQAAFEYRCTKLAINLARQVAPPYQTYMKFHLDSLLPELVWRDFEELDLQASQCCGYGRATIFHWRLRLCESPV
jgi:hypothetical protein